MTGLHERKGPFWVGLAVIILLYCFYYLGFVYDLFLVLPIRGRHLVKLLFICFVYGTGVWALRRHTAAWIMKVWHIVYAISVLLMVGLGMYDWMISRTPVGLREIADDLQELLISPVLYVAMSFMGRYFKR